MSDTPQVDTLKALAHPLRLRILAALKQGERNVGEIEEASGIEQPALSQQLAVLRKAGLVETRREAKMVFYRIDGEVIGQVADGIRQLGGMPEASSPQIRRPASGAANFAEMV